MAWHRRGGSDLLLRAGGLLLLGCAFLAARALPAPAMVAAHGGAGPKDFLLAAIAFLCGCSGVALLLFGAHLFDPVALGPRWRRFLG